MEHLVITGGAGFIGSNLIRWILEREPDTRVTNLDRLTYAGNLENLAGLEDHPRYRFVLGDIADAGSVEEAIGDGADAILNLAAESHVDRSIQDASRFVQTNVLGVQVLLDAARAREVPRFLQVSTDEVYGSLGPQGLFRETDPLVPSSPYSASKAAGDLLALAAHRTFGLAVVVTRASNNYGPYQFPEKLVPLFFVRARAGEPLPVYGDGQQVRDWLFVQDHCAGILAALRRGQPGEVYNIGASCEVTNLEITRRILSYLGQPDTLIRHVADRPGHDRRYALDTSKARRDLGWVPAVSFEEGLHRTLTWYRENEAWVARVTSGEYREYLERQYGRSLPRSPQE